MIGPRFGAAGAVTALLAQGFAVACYHGSHANGPHHMSNRRRSHCGGATVHR